VYFYNGKKQLYGLTMTEGSRYKYNHIYPFLNVIKTLKIEQNKKCNVNQMILKDCISREFGQIQWKTQFGWVSFDLVNKDSSHLNDLDLIFWFQKNLLDTILKLLFSKILEHFKMNKELSKFIMIKLKTTINSI